MAKTGGTGSAGGYARSGSAAAGRYVGGSAMPAGYTGRGSANAGGYTGGKGNTIGYAGMPGKANYGGLEQMSQKYGRINAMPNNQTDTLTITYSITKGDTTQTVSMTYQGDISRLFQYAPQRAGLPAMQNPMLNLPRPSIAGQGIYNTLDPLSEEEKRRQELEKRMATPRYALPEKKYANVQQH